MAKASAAQFSICRRGRASGPTKTLKEVLVHRALANAEQAAKVFYGDAFSDVVTAAKEARSRHSIAHRGRKSSKYKRKLGKSAAKLGVLVSLEREGGAFAPPRLLDFAVRASSNLPKSDWQALLKVETSGISPAWIELVHRAAGSVTEKFKVAAETEQALTSRLSLLANTSPELRRVIESRRDLLERAAELERKTSFVALPRPPGGRAFLKRTPGSSLDGYLLDRATRQQFAKAVEDAGARVVHEGRFGVTVECDASRAAVIVGCALKLEISPKDTSADALEQIAPERLFVTPVDGQGAPHWTLDAVVDDIVFFATPEPLAPDPVPPPFGHPHLSHDKVRAALGAGAACLPWTGCNQGESATPVKVALIDTGCDGGHPAFRTTSGRISYGPTQAGPTPKKDVNGHGTATAWCVLMTAPGAEVIAIAHGGQPDQAFDKAAELGADVICCPWKMPYLAGGTYLEGLINIAIDDGAVVLVAGGNGGEAWPGEMPRVISVGGVYVDPPSGDTRTSDYTSWYESQRYAGRIVPDVCGVSGDLPRGVYLPLPCPSRSLVDQDYGSKAYPQGDDIAVDDGWIFASGSSGAVAQIAGIAALLVQKSRQDGKKIDQVIAKSALKHGSSGLTFVNNALFKTYAGLSGTPVHPGIVNAVASLAMV